MLGDKVDEMDETVMGNRISWPTLIFKISSVYVH